MASFKYGRSSLKRKETCEEKFDQLFGSSSQEDSSERKKLKTASPVSIVWHLFWNILLKAKPGLNYYNVSNYNDVTVV